ncbi:unnamed protein product, partial [marine sediment metagenome]
AQVAIDNSKRKYDVDLDKEIKRFKKLMEINKNGYPEFWSTIRRDFNKSRINKNLKCPMNYLCNLKIQEFKSNMSTLPMSHFFKNFELGSSRRRSKKVEELIERYSFNLYNYNINQDNENDDYLLLRSDFDSLIKDVSLLYISKDYIGVMSWLINRAFLVTPNIQSNKSTIKTNTDINKAILLKTLFSINNQNLLKIFSKNI